MAVVMAMAGLCAGVAVGWWLALARVSALLAKERDAMAEEVRHWQDAAARATSEAARVAQEAKTYADGCRQGRQDVISIVPVLMAAREVSADLAGAVPDDREPR